MIKTSVLTCVALAIAACLPYAQAASSAEPNHDLDVQEYASRYQVTFHEASRRLNMQRRVSRRGLHEELSRKFPEKYAGMFFQHAPKHRLVVQWVGQGKDPNALAAVDDIELLGNTKVAAARHSHATLNDALQDASVIVDRLGIKADIALDVRQNRVAVYVTNVSSADAILKGSSTPMPAGTELVEVAALMSPVTDMGGGWPLSTCTSGFSVRFQTYVGITTAGHCSNQQYYGTHLPYQSGTVSGPYDVQWHTAPGFNVVNKIFIGNGQYRSIASYKSRWAQIPGDWVCKFGMSTAYSCATIIDNQFRPNSADLINPTATYIRAGDPNEEHAREGDSGGPVFFGNIAHGTISGKIIVNPYTVDMVYMPAEYIEQYGLTIMVN